MRGPQSALRILRSQCVSRRVALLSRRNRMQTARHALCCRQLFWEVIAVPQANHRTLLGLHPSTLVIAAGVSAALHIGKLPPAVPVLQAALDISLMQAGFLLSVMQMAGMVLGLAVGLCVDGLGLRRSMLWGLALLALSSAAGALAQGFVWLLALRMVEGLGFLLVVMPGPGLIRRSLAPSQLSARMGWWGSYMPLGTALALLLGPWVLAAGPWGLWWVLLGAVSGLAWWAVLQGVAADPPSAGLAQPPAVGQLAEPGMALPGWKARLALTARSRGPWLMGASFALYSSQWIAVVGFLPTVYAQAGLGASVSGPLTALVAVVNMLGNLAAGRLLQHGHAAGKLLRLGFASMALCAVLAYAQWQGLALLPLWARFLAVLGFSAMGGLIPSTLFTAAMRLAPSSATVSTTVGLMQQCSAIGQFLGPPTVAWVATMAGGWQWTGAVCALLCALGWWAASGIARRWAA